MRATITGDMQPMDERAQLAGKRQMSNNT
jgi:hypothetical protein